jgi:glycosyltransferase involved in cell wall biosynthesis
VKAAYVSPLPPQQSGIADYSALLLPALRERLDLHVVSRRTRVIPSDAAAILYHIGNAAEAHGWILEMLRRRPGVVVLHDFCLHHLVAELTLGKRDREGYARALEHEAGLVGRLLAYGVAEGSLPPLWETSPERFPLAGEVLSLAMGLIVHSAYVERRVRERGYPGPVWRIPHPAWPDPSVEPAELDREASFVVGCFGNLNASKRVPQILEAFASLKQRHPGALLILAGAPGPGLELERRVPELGLRLGEDVAHEARVAEDRLWTLLAACDVCVALRHPTRGETSGMAMRALSIGKPLVVSEAGWFAELPGSVAAKVPVDEREAETLGAFLGLLADDVALRTRMAKAAAEYAQSVHGLERVADLYAAALEEAAGRAALQDAVLTEVAAAARGVGLPDEELAGIALRLRESGLGD